MLEFCQFETMKARCRWSSEMIVMTSARWGRMKTGRCLNIHPKLLALNSNDPMFLGCSEDVLPLLDSKCSTKPTCDVVVPNPDLDKVTPCYEDQTRYLEASYSCVKGIHVYVDFSSVCLLTSFNLSVKIALVSSKKLVSHRCIALQVYVQIGNLGLKTFNI